MKNKVKTNRSIAGESRKKTHKSSPFYTAAIVVCAAVFIFSAYMFFKEYLPQREAAQEMDEIQDIKPVIELADSASQKALPSLDELRKVNKDVVGWIYSEGAKLDYPIVQASDNNYYLKRTFKKKYNASGSIFLDSKNASDFSDQNTVIYGHAMKNGTMFGTLKAYRKQSAYEKDPVITVINENGVYYYQIFSVNVLEAGYDYRESGYGEKLASLAASLRKKSLIKSNAKVGPEDKIITLSTCTDQIDDGRLVIFAVLLNADGEKIDLSKYKP